jgi:GNAT superfamily N-acetyltransferase
VIEDVRPLTNIGPDEVAELWQLCSRDGFATFDDLVGLTAEAFRLALTMEPSQDRSSWFVIRDDGLIGAARLITSSGQRWFGLARVSVVVAARARRRGVGRALGTAAINEAGRRGSTQVLVETRSGGIGADLVGRIRPADLVNRRLRLATADADLLQLRSWMDGAKLEADGYDVLVWAGGVPETWIEEFCRATDALGDQTLGRLGDAAFGCSPAELQDWEELNCRRGTATLTVAIAHGLEVCGYSRYEILADQPEVCRGIDTAVVARHRNRGFGRVLRGRMLHEAIERYPWVRYFEAWNAVTNVPVGVLNQALGFRELERWSEWQLEIAEVNAALGV